MNTYGGSIPCGCPRRLLECLTCFPTPDNHKGLPLRYKVASASFVGTIPCGRPFPYKGEEMQPEEQFVSEKAYHLAKAQHLGTPRVEYRSKFRKYLPFQILIGPLLICVGIGQMMIITGTISDMTGRPFSWSDFQYLMGNNAGLKYDLQELLLIVGLWIISIVAIINAWRSHGLRAIVCAEGLLLVQGKKQQVTRWEEIASVRYLPNYRMAIERTDGEIVKISKRFGSLQNLQTSIELEMKKRPVRA